MFGYHDVENDQLKEHWISPIEIEISACQRKYLNVCLKNCYAQASRFANDQNV